MRGAPGPLLAQLAPGGRFVMPLGADRWTQRLICGTRTGPDAYVEEEFEWSLSCPWAKHTGGRPTPPLVPEDPLNHRKEG